MLWEGRGTRLSKLKGGVRGKYVARSRAGTNLVLLSPEVAEYFPDEQSVNTALRTLIHAAKAPLRGALSMGDEEGKNKVKSHMVRLCSPQAPLKNETPKGAPPNSKACPTRRPSYNHVCLKYAAATFTTGRRRTIKYPKATKTP